MTIQDIRYILFWGKGDFGVIFVFKVNLPAKALYLTTVSINIHYQHGMDTEVYTSLIEVQQY